jgi:hypothetical protein
MDILELVVGIAIILLAVCLRYVAGLQSGWEIVIFWVCWIVGLFFIRDSRKRRKNGSS